MKKRKKSLKPSTKEKKQTSLFDNEYDHDILEEQRKKFKREKRKRVLTVLSVILTIFLIGLYFSSEYSRVGTITIKNTSLVNESTIYDAMEVTSMDFRITTFKSTIRSKLEAVPGVKSVKIKMNIFSGLTVTVEEESVLAFSQDSGEYKIIFGNGTVGTLNNNDYISKLNTYPELHGFGEYLSEFAAKYAKVNDSIRSQFSDIYFTNDSSDPGRVSIYTTNHKTVIVRLDDMLTQLTRYNQVISECPDYSTYDFLGEYVYMK